MTDITTARHNSIFDCSRHRDQVHIIGCGATGSRIFAALVELGVTTISCYDYDIVEAHNLANQLFGHEHINTPKVEALRQWYKWKTGFEPPESMEFHYRKVDMKFPAAPLDGIVFLLTDSMSSRRQIYDTYLHCGVSKHIKQVFETRMAATHGNIHCFDPNDPVQAEQWYNSLTDDAVTELSPCGTPISVGTTAALIANLAVQQYMWLCENPEAMTRTANMYFKPLIAVTEY